MPRINRQVLLQMLYFDRYRFAEQTAFPYTTLQLSENKGLFIMAGSNTNLEKILLIAGCAGIAIAGVIMLFVGATGTDRGLIAYGVAALVVAVLGFIFGLSGHPDVGVTGPPDIGVNRIGGILNVPWWVWLIDVAVIALAVLLAKTVLA